MPDTFQAHDRVRRRADFVRVQQQGRRVSGRFVTLLILANDCTAPRLGLIASRKLGSAVARNRAKRRLRELFRRHRGALGDGAAVDIVAIPRRELSAAPFADVEADFLSTLRRCKRHA
ncbi:MAG TPA: ribonuclease P protein component [Vicinamibacterales bacterium]|nr:ribonuclease P protein component [Vicinamibacterales bacterium]